MDKAFILMLSGQDIKVSSEISNNMDLELKLGPIIRGMKVNILTIKSKAKRYYILLKDRSRYEGVFSFNDIHEHVKYMFDNIVFVMQWNKNKNAWKSKYQMERRKILWCEYLYDKKIGKGVVIWVYGKK